jgi:hypothetical protein
MADEEKGPGAQRSEPEEGRRGMTVSEAGRQGGITVRDEARLTRRSGGGQKVRELIERGKNRG